MACPTFALPRPPSPYLELHRALLGGRCSVTFHSILAPQTAHCRNGSAEPCQKRQVLVGSRSVGPNAALTPTTYEYHASFIPS